MKQKLIKVTIKDIIKMYDSEHLHFYFNSYNELKIDRKDAWSIREKSLYINSLLKGFIVDNFYVAERRNIGFSDFYIINGKQRLYAIIQYVKNLYELSKGCPDVDDKKVESFKFEKLPMYMQTALLNYELSIVTQPCNIQENLDIYTRTNGGLPIKSIDLFRSKLKNNYVVLENISNHKLFDIISNSEIKNNKNYELSLYLLMLESQPSCGLSKDEKEIFIDNLSNELFVNNTILSKLRTKMNYLYDAFYNLEYMNLKEKYLKKSHITIIYQMVNEAIRRKISPREFFNWCNNFFNLNKNAKNNYWIESSRGSTTSKNSMDIRLRELQEDFNNYFKLINTNII